MHEFTQQGVEKRVSLITHLVQVDVQDKFTREFLCHVNVVLEYQTNLAVSIELK